MLLDVKQMDPKFEQWYKEFMSTRFPEIAHFEMVFDKDGYVANQDEKGRYVINMDKGVALSTNKLPQKVNAVYKNKVAGELNIYWNASALNYNPNKSGEQVLRAGFESGVYNPMDLTPELVMFIARSEKISLSDWWKNGAKIKDISYLNGTKAEDFGVLEDYYITSIDHAFYGAENVVSLPEIFTDKPDTLTSLSYAFGNCRNLEAIPAVSTAGAAYFVGAFRNCEKITDLSHINMNKAHTVDYMFSGCKSLKKLPDMSEWTYAPSSFSYMFKDCSSLPAVMTEVLNLSNVPRASALTGMFEGSSVKEITVRYDGEIIPEYICPLFMGSALEKITIVNAQGEVREVRTQANNPSMISFFDPGETKLIVPAGVTSAKVALLSGVTYSFTYNWEGGGTKGIEAKNNISSIMRNGTEVITSNKEAKGYGLDFDWTGHQEQHGGVPAEFDAQYEDYTKKVYCCGMGAGYQSTKYCHAWEALGNSFVQDEISVTPGEELVINVGAGKFTSASSVSSWSKKPANGEMGGYVLVEFH